MKKYEERSGEKYRKRYSGCARRCLNSLTIAVLRKEKVISPPRARNRKEILRRLLGILKAYNGLLWVEGQDKALMRPVVGS
ncbi:MAG: hypothetical protein QXU12_01820 [Nitrososphaerota archaeon]